MLKASRGMMCAMMAPSFCERVNSGANLVCDEMNTLLYTDRIDKTVVLRMKEEFIESI